MTDKDPNEDEFNEEEQDNINEADDSFGLPDLDFEPLDESSSDDEDEPEPAPEEEPETEEPVVEEEPAEEPEVEVELDEVEEEAAEEPVAEDDEIDEPIEEEETEEMTEIADVDEDDVEDTSETETKAYKPPKPESNGPKIVIAIISTIIVAIAVWYFAIYAPGKKKEEEKARTEQLAKDAEQERIAKEQKAEADRIAREAAAKKAEEEARAKGATFTTITEPTRRYYIVIESFVDEDLAADLGKKMAADGVSTALLSPKDGKKRLYRLTLAGDYGSFREAQDEANKLKPDYGDDLWVLRY